MVAVCVSVSILTISVLFTRAALTTLYQPLNSVVNCQLATNQLFLSGYPPSTTAAATAADVSLTVSVVRIKNTRYMYCIVSCMYSHIYTQYVYRYLSYIVLYRQPLDQIIELLASVLTYDDVENRRPLISILPFSESTNHPTSHPLPLIPVVSHFSVSVHFWAFFPSSVCISHMYTYIN